MNANVNTNILETVEFNEDGFMVDANAWTEDIAHAIAEVLGFELTDRHWVVINFARAEYAEKGDAPAIRAITKRTDVGTKELYALFPGGAAKIAAKVAGLPKPTGCI